MLPRVVVVMSKWIFEHILVTRPPANRCDSPAPLGLPRPRCGAASHPHSSPIICRRITGAVPYSASGERGEAPSRDGSARSPGWWRIVPKK